MMKGNFALCRPIIGTILIASLFVIVRPAFALEIYNNAPATLKVQIKDCSANPINIEIPPNQVYGCTFGEECAGVCSYSIKASGNKTCKGSINAGSGLQVGKGLSCKVID